MDQSEHRYRLAFAAADWCFRLHGWPIMPPLLGVYVFIDRPPRPPPTGVSACTAGLLCRRCWASTPSPTGRLVRRRLVLPPARLAAVVGRLRLHRPAASSAADWCFRLHGWPLCRRCWASTSSPTGLPSPLPTGVSACTAGLYAAVVGRLRLHRPACLRRCRLVFPPARLAFMPPLLGVYVFTDRPPRPPPTGASACTAGLYAAVVGRLRLHRPAAPSAADWCFRLHGWPLCRRCWASTSSPTGRLVRRRLVFPPARLAFMPPLLGVYVFTDRLAFAAADWCFRLHGWPLCRRCWASMSSPTGRLVRCRLVFPPARLAFMPPLLGVYVFTDRLAFAAADWCFRLHGWPLCRRCWASMSSPTGRLVRRRLVLPPARLTYYAAVVGRLRLHRPACLRRRRLVFPPARLAFMPPLLGVYVFTDRLAFAAADWCFRLHGWPLCRRCWASTSSPTGLPSPLPTGVSACTADLLCRRCWASTFSPTGLPSPLPTSVSACTAGLLCCRCWASTSSPTGRRIRR
uniref:cysteine dioxygenase n=1 Tax=Oryza sativa subsp. indica TaxID=39946 RepID=A0A8F2VVZ1_ORYSI|nr:hypothetical protein Xa7_IRBB7.18 [Oryza sativa Indica Group]